MRALAVAALALAACKTEPPACNCPTTDAPVCGANGVTYGNACLASCAGAAVAQTGRCPPNPNCTCDGTYALVCGTDGSDYVNRCTADCNHVPVAHDGACAYTPHAGSKACAADGDCGWFSQICGGGCYAKSDPPSQPPPCVGCPQPGCAGVVAQPCYCVSAQCADPFNDGLPEGAPCDPARDLCQAGFLTCCAGDGGAPRCCRM